MLQISEETYKFLIDCYEYTVTSFFNDPVGYIDHRYAVGESVGPLLRNELAKLTKIGKELNIDIISLTTGEDLKYVEDLIQEENNIEDEGFNSADQHCYGHMAMGSPLNNNYIDGDKHIENGDSVIIKKEEDSGTTVSYDCHQLVGEWVSYGNFQPSKQGRVSNV